MLGPSTTIVTEVAESIIGDLSSVCRKWRHRPPSRGNSSASNYYRHRPCARSCRPCDDHQTASNRFSDLRHWPPRYSICVCFVGIRGQEVYSDSCEAATLRTGLESLFLYRISTHRLAFHRVRTNNPNKRPECPAIFIRTASQTVGMCFTLRRAFCR
jgi:hypothetical protein